MGGEGSQRYFVLHPLYPGFDVALISRGGNQQAQDYHLVSEKPDGLFAVNRIDVRAGTWPERQSEESVLAGV